MVTFQIDLIDMQTKSDGAYRYICHTVDHFSKFHVIFPLPSKNATVVAKEFKRHVLSNFGLPKIIHSDNGSEFVNDVITTLVVLWPGHAKFFNGGPGHSQSQGLVEQGNNTIKDCVSARKQEEKECNWSSWLPGIHCNITRFYCKSSPNKNFLRESNLKYLIFLMFYT